MDWDIFHLPHKLLVMRSSDRYLQPTHVFLFQIINHPGIRIADDFLLCI